jgi:hypothetical protein
MAFPKQWDSNGYDWIIPKAKSCTREQEEAVVSCTAACTQQLNVSWC